MPDYMNLSLGERLLLAAKSYLFGLDDILDILTGLLQILLLFLCKGLTALAVGGVNKQTCQSNAKTV